MGCRGADHSSPGPPRSWLRANQPSGFLINRPARLRSRIARTCALQPGERGGNFRTPGSGCGRQATRSDSPGAALFSPCRGASRPSLSTSTPRSRSPRAASSQRLAPGWRGSRVSSAGDAPPGRCRQFLGRSGGTRAGAGLRAWKGGGSLHLERWGWDLGALAQRLCKLHLLVNSAFWDKLCRSPQTLVHRGFSPRHAGRVLRDPFGGPFARRGAPAPGSPTSSVLAWGGAPGRWAFGDPRPGGGRTSEFPPGAGARCWGEGNSGEQADRIGFFSSLWLSGVEKNGPRDRRGRRKVREG